MINRDNTCCFSGYRPEKLPWGTDEDDSRCKALKEVLADAAERIHLSGMRHFLCGMARGSDMYFCEAIIALRAKYPEITLEAAIPFERQAHNWPEADRNRYNDLIEKCDFLTCISRKYTKFCMHQRNRYMVDNSSVLLSVFDGMPGGTNNTITYATRSGLKVIIIKPTNAAGDD